MYREGDKIADSARQQYTNVVEITQHTPPSAAAPQTIDSTTAMAAFLAAMVKVILKGLFG